jgi:hypothetical protein
MRFSEKWWKDKMWLEKVVGVPRNCQDKPNKDVVVKSVTIERV